MYQKILVPIDGSELSNKAVTEASMIAKSSGAKVFLFRASHRPSQPIYTEGMSPSAAVNDSTGSRKDLEEHAKKLLSIGAALAQSEGVVAESEYKFSDKPFEAIIEAAGKHRCDLIAMSSHGHGALGGLLLGSETQKVLANTRLPVLVVR